MQSSQKDIDDTEKTQYTDEPQVPKLAITRNSTGTTESNSNGPYVASTQSFPPRRVDNIENTTNDNGNNSLLRPPNTPLGMTSGNNGDGFPFPYSTRTETNGGVSLYPTTTGYSQWEDTTNDATRETGVPTTPPDRLNDKVPRARPAVDYQDMLWTQIDILDDVRRMADQTSTDGSFFSAEHARALNELRDTQYALLNDLKACEKVLDSSDDHKVIWDSTDIESVRDRLYNREYFDGVKTGLEKVKTRLEDVGESMRKIDDRRE
ncbi:CYFA0S10e00166g1_1 [Cyberlindnera fabianii]|uniref:CYFA0S10e00166g1_1 n=1 Tax=Cyberlindnera fabianii TaxID=36022 RepID=A0A061B6T8_CYBFA|nr:CYFA0S10e00166g1_1 [Cyberlindnera fabianii]